MLLAYVDESYTRDLYWIAALVCPERTIGPLTEALDAVVDKAADAYRGVHSQAELHGYDLFQGKGDWEALAPMPRARIGVYHAAFAAIASFDVEIIIRGMDVKRQRERYVNPDAPHAVVLEHLLERINDCSKARHGRQPVLVIADEVDQQGPVPPQPVVLPEVHDNRLSREEAGLHRGHDPLRALSCESTRASGRPDRLPTLQN